MADKQWPKSTYLSLKQSNMEMCRACCVYMNVPQIKCQYCKTARFYIWNWLVWQCGECTFCYLEKNHTETCVVIVKHSGPENGIYRIAKRCIWSKYSYPQIHFHITHCIMYYFKKAMVWIRRNVRKNLLERRVFWMLEILQCAAFTQTA